LPHFLITKSYLMKNEIFSFIVQTFIRMFCIFTCMNLIVNICISIIPEKRLNFANTIGLFIIAYVISVLIYEQFVKIVKSRAE